MILQGIFRISSVTFFSLQGVEGSGEETNAKRSKQNEGEGNENDPMKVEEESKGGASNSGEEKQNKGNTTKPPEPPKDYIHVRARRGQATDSHSLAERVRITTFVFYHLHTEKLIRKPRSS